MEEGRSHQHCWRSRLQQQSWGWPGSAAHPEVPELVRVEAASSTPAPHPKKSWGCRAESLPSALFARSKNRRAADNVPALGYSSWPFSPFQGHTEGWPWELEHKNLPQEQVEQ